MNPRAARIEVTATTGAAWFPGAAGWNQSRARPWTAGSAAPTGRFPLRTAGRGLRFRVRVANRVETKEPGRAAAYVAAGKGVPPALDPVSALSRRTTPTASSRRCPRRCGSYFGTLTTGNWHSGRLRHDGTGERAAPLPPPGARITARRPFGRVGGSIKPRPSAPVEIAP